MDNKWVFKFDPYDRKAGQVIDGMKAALSDQFQIRIRGRGKGNKHGIALTKAAYVVVYIYQKGTVLPPGNTNDASNIVHAAADGDQKLKDLLEPKDIMPAGGRLGDMMSKLHELEKRNK